MDRSFKNSKKVYLKILQFFVVILYVIFNSETRLEFRLNEKKKQETSKGLNG